MKYVIRTLQQITLNNLGKVTALSPSQWFYTIDRVSAERSRVLWSSLNALPFRSSFRQPLRAVLIRSKFMKSVLLAPYLYHFFLVTLRFEISPKILQYSCICRRKEGKTQWTDYIVADMLSLKRCTVHEIHNMKRSSENLFTQCVCPIEEKWMYKCRN